MNTDYIANWALGIVGSLILLSIAGLARGIAGRLKEVTASIKSKADQETVDRFILRLEKEGLAREAEADKSAAAKLTEEETHRKRMYDRFDQLGAKIDLLATKADVTKEVGVATTRSDDQSLKHGQEAAKMETRLEVTVSKLQQLVVDFDSIPKRLDALEERERARERERVRDSEREKP